MSQNPRFVNMLPTSLNENFSSSVSAVCSIWLSSLRSITENMKNDMRPPTSRQRPSNTGAVSPNERARGMAAEYAACEPMRARATCTPIAVASSLPRNHLAMILVTVMPATSAPTPKMAYPADATITPDLYPRIVAVLPAMAVMA